MKVKQILLVVAISATTAVGSVWAYNKLAKKESYVIGSAQNGFPANYAGFFDGKANTADAIDLTRAANAAVPAVVHIKTKTAARQRTNQVTPRGGGRGDFFDEWFNDLFGGQGGPNVIPEQKASGSGVIISEDGYIVTNNHVITDGSGGVAEEINVTLHNKKTFKAKVVGRDPSSDLAVLKIDGNKFPFLVYGNSTNVQLGQWVLAVGYPLTLEATVTAGIISATGRTININRRQTPNNETPIESFIQTDAAVNQGNSGGALVNANGELIGINSAILAPTGTYAGYSFAIPVHLVKKMVDDIVKYGSVQRGYLGVTYYPTEDLSEEQIKSLGIPATTEGVYVYAVPTAGGAFAAGIKKGDIITKINNVPITSGLQMSAQLAGFRPGDKVPVTFIRSGKEQTITVVLKKEAGVTEDVALTGVGSKLGAELENLDKAKAREYGIAGGVVVKKITSGGLISRTRIGEGYIITSVNGQEVTNIDQLNKIISSLSGPARLEGIYPGYEGVYPYPLNLDGE